MCQRVHDSSKKKGMGLLRVQDSVESAMQRDPAAGVELAPELLEDSIGLLVVPTSVVHSPVCLRRMIQDVVVGLPVEGELQPCRVEVMILKAPEEHGPVNVVDVESHTGAMQILLDEGRDTLHDRRDGRDEERELERASIAPSQSADGAPTPTGRVEELSSPGGVES